ncbi:metalloregulator ArsR/SmtB family transcription factor [Nocardioides sp. zg-1228]|uniref:ArsR/SmtB family transcription factor n=1 Tax=Nocardioides sp. zg-1228 TaxID=2763008 RepID=UPI0016435B58|nr:metalloregulator ArsR/SmtB family transcription factor [Nocardioides sp. zg-1228]MBC2934282.1 metalloregulator ArsR/SmtB family transcription factor [Nocardioides sp. zg-1228]QSF59061.1 metalloregulator ArsR/SmtB family transcription factor [Nocardioides sp. zg-1228]
MNEERRHHLFDELAVVGKAFGSAKRLELVDLLAQGERTVDGLARAAGMGVSTVSAHLQVLKLAHLVLTRREGTKVFYRLAGDDVADLYAAMRAVARDRSADVGRALEAYLDLPGSGEVGLVTRDELEQLLASGEVTLLDVRPAEEYLAGHIPGARSMPLETLDGETDALRHAPPVVAYCRGSFCVMAHDAVRILGGAGVEARRLEDGMLEWRTSGLPVAAGAA